MAKKKKNQNKDKEKAIEMAIDQIEKNYGKGAIMKLGESKQVDVDVIPTGSLALDIALGVGGIPKGRVIEIFGPEASGKTTLAQHIVAEAQNQDGLAAFIDAEHALDPEYAKKIGVDLDDLLLSQPNTGEEALEIAETLVRSNAVDVVVIDSVAALTPEAEIEGEMGDSHVGLQSRLMSQALRKLAWAISKSKTTVIFINQIRMKIGVMFGNPETTPGGRALKFYSSVRLDIRRTGQIKEDEEVIGNETRVKVVKNKVAAPFKTGEFEIMYNEGISKEGNLINVGVKQGIVEKKGAWYNYGDEKLGQGKENAKEYLRENAEIAEEIEKKIKEKAFSPDKEEDGENKDKKSKKKEGKKNKGKEKRKQGQE